MDWNEAKTRLSVVLRTVTTPVQALRVAARDASRALVRQRSLPFLHTLLVLDHPDRMVYVSQGDIEEWDISPDAAFHIGRGNLDPTVGLTRRDDGLWSLDASDGYEATRLILPGWLRSFSNRVDGTPIAIVPHARMLLVGGVADIPRLLDIALKGWETAGTPISPCLYSTDAAGTLVPFVPDATHPLVQEIISRHKRLAHREYERQRDLVSDVSESLLAKIGLIQQDGSSLLLTTTAWTQGTLPMLPITDLVVLHPTDGEALFVSSQKLASVCASDLEVVDGLQPPRFRLAQWPTRTAWEQLRTGESAGK